ncbi:MAG: DNA polymerase III subunit epsilon [Syntrophus sp. (in: bacteria)]|nr:DNA polymerase III subunit epsilon [Syntrophus sp. (in: bacteria)]
MTAAAGSKLRDNLAVRDDGDRLPNYLIKELKETIRQSKRPASSSLPFDEMRFVVMDLETTGFYHHLGDEIISIGAVIIEDGKIKTDKTFHELIDPHCHVPYEVQSLTGIQPEMLAGCPSFFGALQPFLRFIDGNVLVGHNIEFDLGFINHKLKKYCRIKIDNQVLDTITLAKFLGIRSQGFSLDDLLAFYGIESVGRHTALGDALMTADVFLRLLAALKEHSIKTLLGLELATKYYTRYSEAKYL